MSYIEFYTMYISVCTSPHAHPTSTNFLHAPTNQYRPLVPSAFLQQNPSLTTAEGKPDRSEIEGLDENEIIDEFTFVGRNHSRASAETRYSLDIVFLVIVSLG
jgi:hypothetical protein